MPPTVCRERGIHRSSERRALFPTGLTIQALATFLFHCIQHAKVFVSPTITIAKQTGLFFQVEDSGGETASFFMRELGKFSKNFGRAYEPSSWSQ